MDHDRSLHRERARDVRYIITNVKGRSDQALYENLEARLRTALKTIRPTPLLIEPRATNGKQITSACSCIQHFGSCIKHGKVWTQGNRI